MKRIFIAVLFAAACGGKSAPATNHAQHTGEGSGSAGGPMMGHEGEHDDMSPEHTKFHDVLAPLWHAEKSAKRTADTCAAVPEFKTDADEIGKATPPATANADTWTTGTRALVAAVGKLGDACKANDAGKFETAFADVHEAFHSLMGMAGMHHEEGAEDHDHHDMHEGHHEAGGGDGNGGGDHEHKM
jgi:hypothetical protein